MRDEDKQQYLDMIPRVFVRALRDPHGNEEYELSEGEATDLLRRREDARAAEAVTYHGRTLAKLLAHITALQAEADALREALERHERRAEAEAEAGPIRMIHSKDAGRGAPTRTLSADEFAALSPTTSAEE